MRTIFSQHFHSKSYGMFEWKRKRGSLKENRIELTKNKLILC